LSALALALVTDGDVHPRDNGATALGINGFDLTLLAAILAGQHDDAITFAKLGSHHNTSGASEIIFMKFLARSSRTTGPKIRVPIGSPWGLSITAALRSKRINVPSARRTGNAVRTTTALRTSPFFTR